MTTSTSACAGCDKPRASGLNRTTGTDNFPDKKWRYLCPGRGTYGVSEVCFRKALARLKICPGCLKEGEVELGFICYTCRLDVARGASARQKEDGLQWYRIDAREWFPGYPDAEAQGMFMDFLRATSAHLDERPRWGSPSYGKVKGTIRPKRSTSSYLGDDRPAIELTEAQAEALHRFLTLFLKQLVTERVEGRKEGRSLLAGLASGELSVSDYEDESTKLLTGKDLSE